MDDIESGQQEYKDRKGGLIAFGIIEIILGILCLGMVGLMFLGFVIQGSMKTQGMPAQNIGAMINAMGIYGLIAAFFLVMGIGSIKGRRWARAIMLVTSIYWLIVGVFSIIFIAWLMPQIMQTAMATNPGMNGAASSGAAMVATITILLFVGFFFVIVPGAFTLFYRSQHVKTTCEHLDPTPRWTDRAPLPVLFLSLLLASSALMIFFMIGYKGLPLFGYVLTGPLFFSFIAFAGITGLVLAYYIFLRKPWAWLATLLLTITWFLSGIVSLLVMSPDEYMNAISKTKMPGSAAMFKAMMPGLMVLMSVAVLVWVGYLIYMARYFKSTEVDSEAGLHNQPSL